MGALDQGTTSSRFMVFDHKGRVVAAEQRPHEQIYPAPGWVEHDPIEIWRRCREVIAGALEKAGLRPSDLAALGVDVSAAVPSPNSNSTRKPRLLANSIRRCTSARVMGMVRASLSHEFQFATSFCDFSS